MSKYAELLKQIEAAQTAWTHCDWAHEHSETGDICDGDTADCTYCQRAEEAADRARDLGDAAAQYLCTDALSAAVEMLAAARHIEAEYGDAPTWGPVHAAAVSVRAAQRVQWKAEKIG